MIFARADFGLHTPPNFVRARPAALVSQRGGGGVGFGIGTTKEQSFFVSLLARVEEICGESHQHCHPILVPVADAWTWANEGEFR